MAHCNWKGGQRSRYNQLMWMHEGLLACKQDRIYCSKDSGQRGFKRPLQCGFNFTSMNTNWEVNEQNCLSLPSLNIDNNKCLRTPQKWQTNKTAVFSCQISQTLLNCMLILLSTTLIFWYCLHFSILWVWNWFRTSIITLMWSVPISKRWFCFFINSGTLVQE